MRGWMYTSFKLHLSEEMIGSIDPQQCRKYDLFRACGMKGPFVSACPKKNYSKSQKKKNYGGRYKDGSIEEYSDDSSFFSESREEYDDCLSDSSAHEVWAGHFKRYHGNNSCSSRDSYDDADDADDEEEDEGFDNDEFSD